MASGSEVLQLAKETCKCRKEDAHTRSQEGKVALQLRTGNVHLNGAGADFGAPFGGYKQSGNGREWGDFGFDEFLEVKAVLGAAA